MENKVKSFLRASVRQVDEENLRITHIVNTKALDRYDTVVLPKGADVKYFLQNAVVLWAHNMDEATPKIPIARCVNLDIREEEIEVTTEFNRNDPLAVKVFNAYRDGFLHAWSIGFIPKKYKAVDEENVADINEKYGLNISTEALNDASWGIYLIYEWELLEYSAVPVPGNPEALSADKEQAFKRELVSRGLVDKKEANTMDIRAMLKKRKAEEETEEKKDSKVTDEVEEDENKESNTSEESQEEEEKETEEAKEDVADSENESEADETDESEEAEESEEESEEEESEDEDESEEEEEEEESEEEDEEPVESTEDEQEEAESVAEETDSEEEPETDEERTALKETVRTLTQENQTLSKRLADMESRLKAVEKVNETLDEIKRDLDVDNIEKVRDAAQKKKAGHNSDTWFSDFLSGH